MAYLMKKQSLGFHGNSEIGDKERLSPARSGAIFKVHSGVIG